MLLSNVHTLTVAAFYDVTVSEENICHRDLACRNILVAEGNVLKVSDFGTYILSPAGAQGGIIFRGCFQISSTHSDM
jgi:serine/threonine protein kinase